MRNRRRYGEFSHGETRIEAAMKVTATVFIAASLASSLAACGDTAQLPEQASIGSDPPLPEPTKTLIPTINIATASGWPEGAKPTVAGGLAVNAFASDFRHPRWLYVLPNGDVLVAETNAPERPEEGRGIKGAVMKMVQKWAGAGVPSANRITLLRDADGDGVAETKTVFLDKLNSPFGMVLIGSNLYVANTGCASPTRTAIRRLRRPGRKSLTCPPDRSTTTGPRISSPTRTARYCTQRSAPTAMSARTVLRKRRGAPPSWRSTRRAGKAACSPRACAIRMGWAGSQRLVRSGRS